MLYIGVLMVRLRVLSCNDLDLQEIKYVAESFSVQHSELLLVSNCLQLKVDIGEAFNHASIFAVWSSAASNACSSAAAFTHSSTLIFAV